MSSRHSKPIRGLESAKNSPLFQGRFGRMFRALPAASFGNSDEESIENLRTLAGKMIAKPDAPKDGKDDEESGIPALYTYLGQFIDHDLTFDPASSLQKQNDPDALIDFRTPAFDLDNVYGRGPGDQPYMYDGDDHLFLLGEPLHGGAKHARDLPRNRMGRALIGDPRNDENSIVSQLQGLLLRFHNRTIEESRHKAFDEVQQLVRFHYQYVVVNDFLPRIVHSSVLNDLKTEDQYDKKKLEFFHWKNDPFMPVEFSAAAYRFGHSMIRPGYRLNDSVLLPIFSSKGPQHGLTGFGAMDPKRGIDWGRFIDTDIRIYDGSKAENKERLQFAYRIDTSLANPLSDLPAAVVPKSDPPPSLPLRNLERGWRLQLPSGQAVARAMGLKPLDDAQILIGSAVDEPDKRLPNILEATKSKVFVENCPLWTYILAEAMHFKQAVEIPVREYTVVNTPRLGPVGGRIVSEVFLGLLFGDKNSFLNLDPRWTPKSGPNYKLKDFVTYAIGN